MFVFIININDIDINTNILCVKISFISFRLVYFLFCAHNQLFEDLFFLIFLLYFLSYFNFN